jgi:N-acyl-D-amino-acid deacylase
VGQHEPPRFSLCRFEATSSAGNFSNKGKCCASKSPERRFTSLPGARFRIFDRGLLRPGMKADITVFDVAKVADKADFEHPHQYAEGFRDVLVNGKPVLAEAR